jgi:acyl-CoA thioester hydrolase
MQFDVSRIVMTINELQIRVPYADTDQMGMVYYANYLIYFERGRTELLRQLGLPYAQMEEKGILLPVVECNCRYNAPARYDDCIVVRSKIGELGRASIEITYEIECGGRLLVTGFTRHPFVNREFKPVRIPPEIKTVLENAYGH